MWASGTADDTIFAVETKFPMPGTCHIGSSVKNLNLASRSAMRRDSLVVGRQGQTLPCYPSARFSAGRLARRVARPGVRVSTSRARGDQKVGKSCQPIIGLSGNLSRDPPARRLGQLKATRGSEVSTWEQVALLACLGPSPWTPPTTRLSLDNSTHGNAMSTDGWMTKWSFAIHR